MNNTLKKNKRGVSVWFSWVLLVALMVSMSAFMYTFLSGFAEDTAENSKEVVMDSESCSNLGISASVSCGKNSNDLKITLKNVNYQRIDSVSIDLYDVFNSPVQKNKYVNLASGEKKEFSVLKDGVVKEVHVVPVVVRNNKKVYCSNKKIVVSNIKACSD